MIKETSIEEVRQADIVRVIGNYLDLKRAGANYQAKSPFSDDKTPSLTVFKANNNFKDFSSGKGGDAIKFVMEHKGLGFIEAVKVVADICNITLQEEEVSEEVARKRSYRQELTDIMALAASKYEIQLHNLPANHWVKKMIIEREISDETLTTFGIGFAPDDAKFLTNPFIEKAKFEQAKAVGLVGTKDGRTYDFFRSRLMFPIHDFKGNVIAFGGRKANEVDGPKYINSSENEIYSKSNVLYGLFQAKNAINKSKLAVLVEGYTDITSLHQNGCDVAVANCGTTPLSPIQSKLLHRFANHVIICRDNDGTDPNGNEQKGTLAAMRDVNTLLAEGFKVSVCLLPEGEDPDSFGRILEKKRKAFLKENPEATPEQMPISICDYILKEAQDAVFWKTQKLHIKAANDPDAISDAVNDVCLMINEIKDDIKRSVYLKDCSKLMKQPIKVFKDKMDLFIEKAEIKAEVSGAVKHDDAELMGLPDGADYKQYFELGYVKHENNMYFRGREKFFKGSNYKITPLFHVYGKQDNKRLCEVISETGKKKIITFDTSDMVQMAKFETKLLDEGNFTFTPEVSPNHFKLLRNSIMESFTLAHELKQLGWQPEGFYAFSDCVYHKGIRKTANDYGIIQVDVETETSAKSDYQEEIKHYYSPSVSVMHRFSREGDDEYENDRFVIYKQSPTTLNNWMRQMVKVYGEKANIGIAFVFAAIFRDILMKRKGFFPHLFLTGEKGSGKSKFGESLAAMFTFKQEPFDLNSGSPVAFQRRLARVANIVSMFEEYNDALPDVRKQAIKGAYDGRGRELGKLSNDDRTKTTKVRCALIILSQYLSSWDDNSITIRSVILNFVKPLESFTTEQIDDYSILKAWEEKGLTSMLVDILQHREMVEQKYFETYELLNKRMIKELKTQDYEERIMQNFIAMLTPVTLLKDCFRFPFEEKEIWKQFKEAIVDSSSLIVESEGLAEFWRTIEFLLDTFKIIKGKQFAVEKPMTVKIQTRKGEPDEEKKFGGKKHILFLRLNAVHQLYHKEVSVREGVDVINENTLKNYFRSKKYFIGTVKSRRFEDTSTSAYVFDYDMMHNSGILNLMRGEEATDFEETVEELNQPPKAIQMEMPLPGYNTGKKEDDSDVPF